MDEGCGQRKLESRKSTNSLTAQKRTLSQSQSRTLPALQLAIVQMVDGRWDHGLRADLLWEAAPPPSGVKLDVTRQSGGLGTATCTPVPFATSLSNWRATAHHSPNGNAALAGLGRLGLVGLVG